MMKHALVTLSILALISPLAGSAGEPTPGETEVTDCRFESDVKAKGDLEAQDSSTKEAKGDKKAVNGT